MPGVDFFIMIPSALSAFSSICFLSCFFYFEGVRLRFTMKLIAVLQFIDLILSINRFIPYELFGSGSTLCKAQLFIEQFFSSFEVIWTIWISVFVYRNVCQRKQKYEIFNLKFKIFITFSISFPPALIFELIGYYKSTSTECYTGSENRFTQFFIIHLLTFYLFIFISFAWGLFAMCSVHNEIKKNNGFIDKNILRMEIYPIIVLFCYLFTFFYRVCLFFEYDLPELYVSLSFGFASLGGFFNSLILGFTEEFRSGIKFARGRETNEFF